MEKSEAAYNIGDITQALAFYKKVLVINPQHILAKMNIIEKYSLEEFNINEFYFKIYYYGNPKRLKTELSDLGYYLKNDQGYWDIYKNE